MAIRLQAQTLMTHRDYGFAVVEQAFWLVEPRTSFLRRRMKASRCLGYRWRPFPGLEVQQDIGQPPESRWEAGRHQWFTGSDGYIQSGHSQTGHDGQLRNNSLISGTVRVVVPD